VSSDERLEVFQCRSVVSMAARAGRTNAELNRTAESHTTSAALARRSPSLQITSGAEEPLS
jgi:hypothetical protein